jgi:hypothetical protein
LLRGIKTVLGSQRRSFGVLASGLLIITVLTTGAGIWHHNYELSHQSSPDSSKNVAKASNDQSAQTSVTASPENVLGETSPTGQTQPKSCATKPSTNQCPTSRARTQKPSTVSATLSINGASKGMVTLAANSNHCDVLNQALKNGQISSLDLRYSSQYGTYAVYMIDGVGDSNAVWWTYKVNGSSPPYGCSQMPVKDGDSVHWQYVKR